MCFTVPRASAQNVDTSFAKRISAALANPICSEVAEGLRATSLAAARISSMLQIALVARALNVEIGIFALTLPELMQHVLQEVIVIYRQRRQAGDQIGEFGAHLCGPIFRNGILQLIPGSIHDSTGARQIGWVPQ